MDLRVVRNDKKQKLVSTLKDLAAKAEDKFKEQYPDVYLTCLVYLKPIWKPGKEQIAAIDQIVEAIYQRLQDSKAELPDIIEDFFIIPTETTVSQNK